MPKTLEPKLFESGETDSSKEKQHFHGHRQRLRERFLSSKGQGVADYELLEMLLFASSPRTDVKPLAKQLIAKFGTLGKVLAASHEELAQIEGVSDTAIVSIKVVEVAAHHMLKNELMEEKPVIQSWKALLDYCRATLQHSKVEQFRIFS